MDRIMLRKRLRALKLLHKLERMRQLTKSQKYQQRIWVGEILKTHEELKPFIH